MESHAKQIPFKQPVHLTINKHGGPSDASEVSQEFPIVFLILKRISSWHGCLPSHIALEGMLSFRHLWFLSPCSPDQQYEFCERQMKNPKAWVIINCSWPVGSTLKMTVWHNSSHPVRSWVFLGERSVWDTRALTVGSTQDENLSGLAGWDVKER
jgi:hypothetical protein